MSTLEIKADRGAKVYSLRVTIDNLPWESVQAIMWECERDREKGNDYFLRLLENNLGRFLSV